MNIIIYIYRERYNFNIIYRKMIKYNIGWVRLFMEGGGGIILIEINFYNIG